MEISEKIKIIRKEKGFSQEELARFLKVSFPTVNAWERGKSTPYPRHQKATPVSPASGRTPNW